MMGNPLTGVLCPHCQEYVDVVYGECASCGESIEDCEEDVYDDISARVATMEEYLADESTMRNYTLLDCNLKDAPTSIICHQIDCEGKMNTPIAQSILAKNPKVKEEYDKVRSQGYSPDDLLGGFIGTRLGEDDYDSRLPGWCLSLVTYLENEKFYGRDAANVPDWLVYAERLGEALDRVAGIITGNEVAFPWAEESDYWDITLTLILKRLPHAKKIYFCK